MLRDSKPARCAQGEIIRKHEFQIFNALVVIDFHLCPPSSTVILCYIKLAMGFDYCCDA